VLRSFLKGSRKNMNLVGEKNKFAAIQDRCGGKTLLEQQGTQNLLAASLQT